MHTRILVYKVYNRILAYNLKSQQEAPQRMMRKNHPPSIFDYSLGSDFRQLSRPTALFTGWASRVSVGKEWAIFIAKPHVGQCVKRRTFNNAPAVESQCAASDRATVLKTSNTPRIGAKASRSLTKYNRSYWSKYSTTCQDAVHIKKPQTFQLDRAIRALNS